MANGRCRVHGGKAPGPKDHHDVSGPKNPAYAYGIYTKFYREDEKVLLDEGAIRLGQVDDELRVMRIRLKRTLEAKEAWEAERATDAAKGVEAKPDEHSAFVTVEVSDDQGITKDGDVLDTRKVVKRIPDFDKIIDVTLARIESLEKTRKELLKDGDDPDDPEAESGRDRVTFTGGLGGDDGELPSPFKAKK